MLNRITTKAGQRDAVVQILILAARLQCAMPGCDIYVIHQSPDDANLL